MARVYVHEQKTGGVHGALGTLVGSTDVANILAASPQITGATLTSPTILGAQTAGAVLGGAGSRTTVSKRTTALDTVATDLFTVTVPNAVHGAFIRLEIGGVLGDGDSTDSKVYVIGVSRVTGAAAKAVASTAGLVGKTTGVSGSATTVGAVSAIAGAVGAANTFTITGAVTKSAGSSDSHTIIALATMMNGNATGIQIVAA